MVVSRGARTATIQSSARMLSSNHAFANVHCRRIVRSLTRQQLGDFFIGQPAKNFNTTMRASSGFFAPPAQRLVDQKHAVIRGGRRQIKFLQLHADAVATALELPGFAPGAFDQGCAWLFPPPRQRNGPVLLGAMTVANLRNQASCTSAVGWSVWPAASAPCGRPPSGAVPHKRAVTVLRGLLLAPPTACSTKVMSTMLGVELSVNNWGRRPNSASAAKDVDAATHRSRRRLAPKNRIYL